ncbi:glycosyltransferase family 4 protein [Qipengyuania sediminis]|uniref:glycosyltransferase family 4 protein n=1 Tax=Qipengyuania sediminis TaxID=1532023 RepID=UPI00105AA8B0|nr:glycosyltransferase family 4 protein [Qipengyuania sediminis]
MSGVPRLLHIAGGFSAGDPQAERCVRICNLFGNRLRHVFVSGDGSWSALDGLAKGIPGERRPGFPRLAGLPLPGRLQAIARQMVDANLICTYGRGGVRAALAHTLFSDLLRLPPLIHHEDGSDETERGRHAIGSTWARRLGLGKAAGLVVPTELMEGEALVHWQQPLGRVKVIRDGVELARFAAMPKKPPRLARLVKRADERWIVCEAGTEATAALASGLTACGPEWHLVVIGDGVEAPAGIEHRVHRVAASEDRAALMHLADIVAVAPGRELLPMRAIEAMAAGRPVVGFETGAMRTNFPPENAPFLAAAGDHAGLIARMRSLAGDSACIETIGQANRTRAARERDAGAMIAAYRRLYASAMRRETI